MTALADTAARFTKIPRSAILKIGAEPLYETEVELGTRRTVTRALALADVAIDGVRRPVLVAVGEEAERPLVGYATLETLGFKVNSGTHSLEPTAAIEY